MKSAAEEIVHLLMAIALTSVFIAIAFYAENQGINYVLAIFWLLTPFIAAIEVKRLKFHEYRITYPYKPVGTFFFVLFIWLIAFPWFLSSWLNIVRGVAKKRNAPPERLSPLVRHLLKKNSRE